MSAQQEGPLEQASIALAPLSHGAYRLWHEGRVLYIGMTSGARTLRSELMRHWRGARARRGGAWWPWGGSFWAPGGGGAASSACRRRRWTRRTPFIFRSIT